MPKIDTDVSQVLREYHPLRWLPIPTQVLHELERPLLTEVVKLDLETHAAVLKAQLDGAERAAELMG
jgi:hypothetical protein